MNKLLLILIGFVLIATTTPSYADDWTGTFFSNPAFSGVSYGGTNTASTTQQIDAAHSYIMLGSIYQSDPSSPDLHLTFPLGELSLDRFASSGSIEKLQAGLNKALQLPWIGASLAAALDSAMPKDGASNRFGMNVATIQGHTSLGMTYTRSLRQFDVTAGLATNLTAGSRYVLARGGIGFSW